MVRRSAWVVLTWLAIAGPVSTSPAQADTVSSSGVSPELREQAVAVLREALDNGQRWVKVHAAEALLALDYGRDVRPAFEKELALFGDEPQYRVGIWRVLAASAPDERERNRWITEIREAFLDPQGPDRNHAAETLGKLHVVPARETAESLARAAADSDDPLAVYALWVLANSGSPESEAALADLLAGGESGMRGSAAYALRFIRPIRPETRARLVAAARAEPAGAPSRVYLLSAAAIHAPPGELEAWKAELRPYVLHGEPDAQYEACTALAFVGDQGDAAVLAGLLSVTNRDTRIAAATALLRIGRRAPHHVTAFDWVIVGVYCLGMLAVGWHYSRRNRNTEDYLLGGRRMNPLAVGLSLFATLMSTISYLSWPGEMVRYGPLMMIGAVSAYPFIALIVGYLMIPFIMRLRVTSAYEILQERFGRGIRMVGSTIFLVTRLVWMAVIVHATVDKVLVPLTGVNPSLSPYLCAGMGLIVLVYTSMGGIRAVVLTDVIQSLILFGGAVLILVVITVQLGGFSAWWPRKWPAHWPEPVWLFATHTRTTFAGIFVATFTWYLCTSGSDQLAIQRYLATRDARAARAVLVTSLISDGLTTLFLGLLGLPLLAYFQAHPEMIPDGQTIVGNGDTLMPQFISFGLPVGIVGLVIAGLLAAAMSSLSSGVNATCSVIMTDFLGRSGDEESWQRGQVRLARFVSVAVGAVVILISSCVGVVKGNLLEVAMKLVNPLAAPLFGLFFMAMFVRWATAAGTLVGLLAGLVVVFGIGYWQELTGTRTISFIWAMPLGLTAQIMVGMVASAILPVRPPRATKLDRPRSRAVS